jgi:hypothetical protein
VVWFPLLDTACRAAHSADIGFSKYGYYWCFID